jgi:Holliday junction DNA helicase RuvA
MINLIKGTLLEISPPFITVEVNGIAYEIALPLSHLLQLPPLGASLQLYTQHCFREDAQLLFGFNSKSERDCFRQLIKVSGIGPKIALALLSTLNSTQVAQAIAHGDLNTLCLTPGIGKKVAERMVLELKGKLLLNSESMLNPAEQNNNFATDNALKKDISQALESLGYNNKEINQVLNQLPDIDNLSLGIKEALKLLGKH